MIEDVEFSNHVEIGHQLRRLIHAARTAPERWPRGTPSQDTVGRWAGMTPAWYRRIESGATTGASLAAILDICQVLGISPAALRILGYEDVAASLEARYEISHQVVVDVDRIQAALTEEERQALEVILDLARTEGGWRKNQTKRV